MIRFHSAFVPLYFYLKKSVNLPKTKFKPKSWILQFVNQKSKVTNIFVRNYSDLLVRFGRMGTI